jgi:hypothetical protein
VEALEMVWATFGVNFLTFWGEPLPPLSSIYLLVNLTTWQLDTWFFSSSGKNVARGGKGPKTGFEHVCRF